MVLFDLKFDWEREGIKEKEEKKETCKKLEHTILFHLDYFFEIFWIAFRSF